MIQYNVTVNILKKTAIVFEGEPPGDLPISLIYDEPAKFQIKSSVSLPDTGNTLTITGVKDNDPLIENITCKELIVESSNTFDSVSSFTFDFDTETNITIRVMTGNGDDNVTMMAIYHAVSARVIPLKWSFALQDMGVVLDKSKMIYLPTYIVINNSMIIELNEESYEIKSITFGIDHNEVIISRIDNG